MNGLTEFFETTTRQSYSLGLSVVMHAVILFFMLFNFSWAINDTDKTPPAVLMVDLTKVQLGDKTNLPPKAEKKKEEPEPVVQPQEKPKEQPQEPITKTPVVKQEAPKKEAEVKPAEKEMPKEAAKVVEKKEPKVEKPKEKPKEVAKPKEKPKPKPQPKVQPKPKPKPQPKSGLQSLLASVEKVKKPINPIPKEIEDVDESLTVNEGIEGGTSGSRLEILSISEKDFIANMIRQHWNVNAGVENAETMIVELNVLLNKDGSVKDVKILNQKNNPAFKSMAESARRAIYICDGLGEESPFRILAKKHTKNYNTWKNIHLNMNPIKGEVF